MNVRFIVPCTQVVNANGFITAHGIIDYFFAESFPSVELNVGLLTAFTFGPFEVGVDKIVEVKLVTPDGEVLGRVTQPLVVPAPPLEGAYPSVYIPVHFSFSASLPGDYEFIVSNVTGGQATVLGKATLPVCRKAPKLVLPS